VMFARQPMRSRLGGTAVSPPICSHRISAKDLRKAGHRDRLFFDKAG
jgi:hypothetical protein